MSNAVQNGPSLQKCSQKTEDGIITTRPLSDPAESLASLRHEFGEHGGVNMSIEPSVTFTVMEPEIMPRMFKGELGPDKDFYIYSRNFNPTISNLARKLAALEGTEAAYCTSSGMSAITSVLLQICRTGDHIVASNCLYGGTHALLTTFLPSRFESSTYMQELYVDLPA